MEESKKHALLAYYNRFTDALGTVECGDLSDVVYILHTVVQFVKTGTISYKDHRDFGCAETVEFLRFEINSAMSDDVLLNKAKEGDEYEIAKLLVLLLLAVQQGRKNAFEEQINFLPSSHRDELSAIIMYLESPDVWPPNGSWHEVLTHPLSDSNNSTGEGDEACLHSNKNQSFICDPRAKAILASSSSSCRESNGAGGDKRMSDDTLFRRRESSRREEQRESLIGSMKSRLDHFEEEYESCRQDAEGFRLQVEVLEKQKEILSAKVDALLEENETIEPLRSQVHELEQKLSETKMELNRERQAYNSSKITRNQLRFELDGAIRQAENAQRERDAAVDNLEESRQCLEDELNKHNITRQEFAQLESQLVECQALCKRRVVETEDQLAEKERHFCLRLNQMRDELRSNNDSLAEIEREYKQRIEQLELAGNLDKCEEIPHKVFEEAIIQRDEAVLKCDKAVQVHCVEVPGEESQQRQTGVRGWIVGKIFAIILISIVGFLLVLSVIGNPPLFSRKGILVPWKWPIFALK